MHPLLGAAQSPGSGQRQGGVFSGADGLGSETGLAESRGTESLMVQSLFPSVQELCVWMRSMVQQRRSRERVQCMYLEVNVERKNDCYLGRRSGEREEYK